MTHGGDGGGRNPGTVRVAVVAETFHPDVNGVSNSVCRVLAHLAGTGHDAIVIAPSRAAGRRAAWSAEVEPGEWHRGFPVIRVPSFRPPMYGAVHLGRPGAVASDSGQAAQAWPVGAP